MEIPRWWRTREIRYRLLGSNCPECGIKHFPPRPICPDCGHSRIPFPTPDGKPLEVRIYQRGSDGKLKLVDSHH